MEIKKRKVRYEEMLPHELEETVRNFPVAYVPLGSLEWHGRHLPLGTDGIKAYYILIKAAEKFGGVVVPPTYWGLIGKDVYPWSIGNFEETLIEEIVERIFWGLVDAGFKVIIGVTGHDVDSLKKVMEKAIDKIKRSGRATGAAFMEGELYDLTDDKMDHAAHWETSIMMYLRPDLVNIDQIKEEDLESSEGRKKAGIWGLDPRIYASMNLGQKIVERIVERIGQVAQKLVYTMENKGAEEQ